MRSVQRHCITRRPSLSFDGESRLPRRDRGLLPHFHGSLSSPRQSPGPPIDINAERSRRRDPTYVIAVLRGPTWGPALAIDADVNPAESLADGR
jgi:hypothetical protein